MGDGNGPACRWCGTPLPPHRAAVRRYCCPAHRQAGYRARRRETSRARAALSPQVGIASIAVNLHERAEALMGLIEDVTTHPDRVEPGLHCAAVSGLAGLVDDLTGCAVIADRRGGATWAQVGAALGLSATAARARYGRRRMTVEQSGPQ